MNMQILQWLLKNRDVLLQVVAVAKTYDKTKSYLTQWEVVDKIARLVLPILEAETIQPKLLSADMGWDYEDDGASAMSAGADLHALGIDYKLILDVVIPIIIAILQALVGREEE
jgi:hypothetical protein